MNERELPFISELAGNLNDSPQFLQVILGPRQVGKTTGILSFLETYRGESLYFSADELLAPGPGWIEEKWQAALLKNSSCLLVIDEIQKVPNWSQTIKKIWDAQKRAKNSYRRLVLLGSSSLELHTGLSESLAGRFQLIRATHWGFKRSLTLRQMSVEDFVQYGGYPGSYSLLHAPRKWEKYIRDSIIETVIGKDILQSAKVQKPALFRQAFGLLMSYPAQDISYTKLLGQLQDAGNTDLVKRYIDLYEGAFLIKSVHKYSGKAVVSRSSSPKIIPLCGALISREIFSTQEGYGRAFEAAVGACLINHGFETTYWRDHTLEVDFVVEDRGRLFAIEVKSGRRKSTKGMIDFLQRFPKASAVYVTPQNIELFLNDPSGFLKTLA
ncbi:MAG: AAA family ATPase [Bdellovibrio sp.]|nr:MAG: AAA family ATPase [Bdellovibrio sp.]